MPTSNCELGALVDAAKNVRREKGNWLEWGLFRGRAPNTAKQRAWRFDEVRRFPSVSYNNAAPIYHTIGRFYALFHPIRNHLKQDVRRERE